MHIHIKFTKKYMYPNRLSLIWFYYYSLTLISCTSFSFLHITTLRTMQELCFLAFNNQDISRIDYRIQYGQIFIRWFVCSYPMRCEYQRICSRNRNTKWGERKTNCGGKLLLHLLIVILHPSLSIHCGHWCFGEIWV